MGSSNIVLETNLPYPLLKRGKVRDVYVSNQDLLIVSTDRISAFDVVLPNGIPCKGEALNKISVFWFNETKNIIKNHIMEVVDSRTVRVRKTDPVKAEFVVRGYLYGSAWENYASGRKISGIELPPGLKKAQKIPEPILTPTTKADTGHDIEMTKNLLKDKIGEDLANQIEEVSLKIYDAGAKKAQSVGIIIADTKFEFGLLDNELILIDEVLTPDSSRFWPKETYEVGGDPPSFDKQYVRDYLTSTRWNKKPPAPTLPETVVFETSKKYVEAYERLTGKKFNDPNS